MTAEYLRNKSLRLFRPAPGANDVFIAGKYTPEGIEFFTTLLTMVRVYRHVYHLKPDLIQVYLEYFSEECDFYLQPSVDFIPAFLYPFYERSI
jgi:hypothetical protein